MRLIFSALGLLVVLALVAWLFKQQAQGLKPAPVAPVSTEAPASGPVPPANAVQKVGQDLAKALAQDAARAASGVTP